MCAIITRASVEAKTTTAYDVEVMGSVIYLIPLWACVMDMKISLQYHGEDRRGSGRGLRSTKKADATLDA